METNELMKRKVNDFLKNKIPVHIIKKNGFFHNGIILEASGDLIILDDERNGAMQIYFIEILEIQKRREKDNGRKD